MKNFNNEIIGWNYCYPTIKTKEEIKKEIENKGYIYIGITEEEVPCGNACGTTHVHKVWFTKLKIGA